MFLIYRENDVFEMSFDDFQAYSIDKFKNKCIKFFLKVKEQNQIMSHFEEKLLICRLTPRIEVI